MSNILEIDRVLDGGGGFGNDFCGLLTISKYFCELCVVMVCEECGDWVVVKNKFMDYFELWF